MKGVDDANRCLAHWVTCIPLILITDPRGLAFAGQGPKNVSLDFPCPDPKGLKPRETTKKIRPRRFPTISHISLQACYTLGTRYNSHSWRSKVCTSEQASTKTRLRLQRKAMDPEERRRRWPSTRLAARSRQTWRPAFTLSSRHPSLSDARVRISLARTLGPGLLEMDQKPIEKTLVSRQVIVVHFSIVVEFEVVAAHLFPDEDRLVGDVLYYSVAIPQKDVGHVVSPGVDLEFLELHAHHGREAGPYFGIDVNVWKVLGCGEPDQADVIVGQLPGQGHVRIPEQLPVL